jgi:C1A family cysteine protease
MLSGTLSFLVLAACTQGFAQSQPAANELSAQISSLQSTINAKGAQWIAGETSVSKLPMAEKMRRVGLNFAPIKAPPLRALSATKVPASVDYRSNGGVSGVRDQGNCGSCWAFAMTGGLESNVMLSQNMSSDLNLSEQVLVSCSGAGSCDGGSLNADYLQSTGLPPASYYPYTATDGTCSDAQAGWQSHTYKIGSWNSVDQDLSAIKSALATTGPLPTAFMVYEDFMNYKSGVYSYTSGKQLGGHGVLIVGYNDDGQYFIVKNSWGPDWGEGGFFRIAYSEMKSVCSFGMSTIAYQPAQTQDSLSLSATPSPAADRVSSEKTMKQLEPLLLQKP